MTKYRTSIEKDQILDYLHMVLIFTSAALKSPYPLEMLSNVANPCHIQTLLKILVDSSPMAKLTVISILKNLVRVKVPESIFSESLSNLQSINFKMPSNICFGNSLV